MSTGGELTRAGSQGHRFPVARANTKETRSARWGSMSKRDRCGFGFGVVLLSAAVVYAIGVLALSRVPQPPAGV